MLFDHYMIHTVRMYSSNQRQHHICNDSVRLSVNQICITTNKSRAVTHWRVRESVFSSNKVTGIRSCVEGWTIPSTCPGPNTMKQELLNQTLLTKLWKVGEDLSCYATQAASSQETITVKHYSSLLMTHKCCINIKISWITKSTACDELIDKSHMSFSKLYMEEN